MEDSQTYEDYLSPCSWQPRRCRKPRANTTTYEANGGVLACTPHEATPTAYQGTHITNLPEDVHQHILSIMTMRDAARAACVSRKFLSYWRCYPNLSFNQEALVAHRQPLLPSQYRGKYIFSKTRHVLENHYGKGVKTLKLNLSICSKEDIDTGLVNGWLQAFVKPGITELSLLLPRCYALEYNFPYSLLSWDEEFGATIQSLHLASCGFHPTEGPRLLGFTRSLSKVSLHNVGITEDELGFFLSSCFDLERLDLSNCNMIASLKIPRVLHKLRIVRIHACRALKTVVSNAPNLSTINYDGGPPLLSFSLGDRLETKKLLMHSMCMEDMIGYAGSDLPCIAPNLQTLVLSTFCEKINARRMTVKFQHLKRLVICLGRGAKFSEGHNFFSLACFLHACVVLETFTLRIAFNYSWNEKYHISWQTKEETSQFCHGGLKRLRKVTITGFCSAQSLAELTCHILSYAASSLQCILLDTTPGYDTKHSSTDRCWNMHAAALRESKRALSNVRQYVEPEVPQGVELKVLGPCRQCHYIDAKAMEEAQRASWLSAQRAPWRSTRRGRIMFIS